MEFPLVAGIVFVAVIIGLAFWVYERFVNTQLAIVPDASNSARFPAVRGSSLSKRDYVFPGDIEGRVALLMIAFQQIQQIEVNTWLPAARVLAEQHADFSYYELPTIQRLTAPARAFIDGGMRAGIPDQTARDTTITLYLDKGAFRRALKIPTEDSITVMLVDPKGAVFWRAQGPATEQLESDLEAAVNQALAIK